MAQRELNIIANLRDNVSGQLKGIQGNIQRMRPTFRKMALYGTAAFGAITAGAIKTSQDAGMAEGAWNKFNTVFAGGADDMKDWVGDIRKIMPTATHEIARMAADLQDLLVPMGLARDEAQGLTKESVELANKIAAFNDVDPTEVLEAMKSGFTGMSEPLRRFGVDARVTSLEAVAQKEGLMGLTETFKTLDPAIRQSVQAQALMIQMTNQSSDAINGFEANQDSYIRRTQEMKAQITDLSVALGEALMPILDDAVKAITPVIKKFVKWAEENPELVKQITITTTAITGLVAVVGILGMMLIPLKAGILGVGAAFAFLASPIGLIIVLIGLLAGLGWYLYNNWEAVVGGLEILWEDMSEIFTKVWGNIKETTKKTINLMIGFVEGFANSWVKAVNTIVRAINSLSISIPDWVPGIGGRGWSPNLKRMSEVNIPRLHNGGFINAPANQEFPAMIRGQEAIVPMDKGGIGTTVNVYISGDVSGDDLIEKVKKGIMGDIKHNMAI